MAFLFGWQSSDLGATTVKNRTAPNVVLAFEPQGGFTVPEDCVAKRIYVDVQDDSASDVFTLGLLDRATNQIIAKSAEYSVSIGGFFVDIPHTQLTQGQRIAVVWHTNGYIQATIESTNFRYFETTPVDYADGMPNTFTKTGSTNSGRSEIWVDGDLATSATISNLNTNNNVSTYQQVNANGVSGFTGQVVSGTLGGQPVSIINGDWQSNSGVVSLRVPGNLTTGSYDLVLSDGTNTATLSSVSFTQTHPFEAPYKLVDSNSLSSDQKWTSGSYVRVVTQPSHGVLNTSRADWLEVNVNEVYTPNIGYTGKDTIVLEIIYSDGATDTWFVTLTIGDGVIVKISLRLFKDNFSKELFETLFKGA